MLVDGGQEILASFGDRLSEKAARGARRLGVRIRTGTVVTGVDAFGVEVTDGRRVVRANRCPDEDLGRGGRGVATGAACSPRPAGRRGPGGAHRSARRLHACPAIPEVFAIGDMMALDDLPGVAEVAMQSGIHAANTIKRRLHGKEAADVHLPRPGQHGDDLAVPRRRQLQGAAAVRLPRLADVARRAPHLPHRVQEPILLPVQLGAPPSSRAAGPSGRSRSRQTIGRVVIEEAGGEGLTRHLIIADITTSARGNP